MIKKLNNKKSSKGTLHLSDLKIVKNIQSEQFYFKLKKEYHERLFKKALSISKNVKNLAKETNINYFNLWDSIKRTPISLSNINKLFKFLVKNDSNEFSLEGIEKNIEYIKGGFTNEKVHNPNFPFNFLSKEGMRFIAHLYHDGCIGKDNRQPHYINQSLEECKGFLEDSKKIFGKISRVIKKNKSGTHSVHLPTIIGDIIISLGYVPGDKTKNNAKTFKFLNDIQDKSLISEYLAKAFNDDGYVLKRGIGLQQSSLIKKDKLVPSNILLLDKKFLERIGIKVLGPTLKNKYKNRYGICANFRIDIYSKENIRKFHDSIKLIDYKRKKIEKFLTQGYKIKKDKVYK